MENAHGWDHSQTIAQFQERKEEDETNGVAMEVSKREQMPEKCCGHSAEFSPWWNIQSEWNGGDRRVA